MSRSAMTPLALARAECSNYKSDDCMGIQIRDDLSIAMTKQGGGCVLAKGERCPFFEYAVMPLAEYMTNSSTSDAYKGAAFLYRSMHPESGLINTNRPKHKTRQKK